MHSDDASPNGQLLGDCCRRAIPRSGSGWSGPRARWSSRTCSHAPAHDFRIEDLW